MKNLVIIGARGFGREIYSIAIQCKEYNTEWKIKGFLDDKQNALEEYEGYPPILGPVESYQVQDGDIFVCALGDIEPRKKYIGMILEKGGVFVNIIHPTTLVYNNAKLGKGIIANAYSVISNDTLIGDFVIIQSHVAIGHDVKIGNWTVVNSFAFLGGFVKVEDAAVLGPGSKVMPRKTVGEGTTVGIGSVVTRNVKPKTTVFGAPAKEIL